MKSRVSLTVNYLAKAIVEADADIARIEAQLAKMKAANGRRGVELARQIGREIASVPSVVKNRRASR